MVKGAKDSTASGKPPVPTLFPLAPTLTPWAREGCGGVNGREEGPENKKKQNKDLTLNKFLVAGQQFLAAIHQAKWPTALLPCLASFTPRSVITLHDLHTEIDI